jgi:glycosyltransferase involved in cell wall biosynthesis
MKVLFVSSGNSQNGISPIIKNQGYSLQEAGLTIGFFAISGKGFKGYLKKILELRKYLINNTYDIIHAHYGLSAIVALVAKKKEKLIVSFMGDDLIGSNKPHGSITFVSKLVILLNTFLANTFYDYCIVKSEEMYNILKVEHKALIPNGIDLNVFYQIPKDKAALILGFNTNDKIAIFIANTSRVEKNFNLAVESVKRVNDYNLKLIPVSGVIQSQIVYYYNAADLLLLTSFHEGSPNVIKEAMACNCPIVSTDVGDVKWVIGDTNGCFISSFDPEDFSNKIKLGIDFRDKHGQTKGRERIIELGLDSKSIACKIIEVYKKASNC